jgi:hypothetical protein
MVSFPGNDSIHRCAAAHPRCWRLASDPVADYRAK